MKKNLRFILTHSLPEVKNLQRKMLIENGFFQILESREESILLTANQNDFLLLTLDTLSLSLKEKLKTHSLFLLIVSQQELSHPAIIEFGVKHIVTFPYSSDVLIEKVNQILA